MQRLNVKLNPWVCLQTNASLAPFTPHLVPLLVATVALTLSACVSAEIEPPEIKALIGMKIPPAIEGKASGNIPDFVSVGSLLGVDFEDGFSFAFEEGLYANKWYVLIASRFFEWFRGEEIVAVLVLPEKLRNWEYRNGIFEPRREGLPFSRRCRSSEDDKRVIVAFYEQRIGKNCVYARSDKVKRAWMFDVHKRAFFPIPTKGLWCEDPVDEECGE